MQGDISKAKERIGCGAIVVSTLADAHEQIRLLLQRLLPQPEQQAPPEPAQMIMHRAHPSNYSPNIDVRPTSPRVMPANAVDSERIISN
jgi:hypothetical protein